MTLDGYIAGEGSDISWHMVDDEFQELANAASNSGNTLLFERITYELMAGFWPTAEAITADPVVAAGMNKAEKIAFSRTLNKAEWNNTRLVKDDMIGEVKRLKEPAGKDLTVLGSGNIVSQLAQEGLIDEYSVLLNPVVIGTENGVRRPEEMLALKLIETRRFRNGNVLLRYEPAGKEN